jgi:GNAT superfamily N-acetyltransferase
MKVMIRTIGAEEWPVWRDLRLRALADAPDAFRPTLEEESSQSDQWWGELIRATVEHPRGGLWVAWADDEAVGMLFGRVDEEHTVLEIGAMWVAPDVRRQSVGTGLMEAAIEWARGLGVSVASLWATEDNAGAGAFYRRHGFQATEVTDALRPGSHLTVRKLEAGL